MDSKKDKFTKMVAGSCHVNKNMNCYANAAISNTSISNDNLTVGDDSLTFQYNPNVYDNPNWGTGGGGGGYTGNGGWTNGNDLVINTKDTVKIVPNQPVFNGWEKDTDIFKIIGDQLKKTSNLPNKVDKDLININLPYNLKKNYKEDLYYEFAVAGYSAERILLQKITNGIRLILSEQKEEDDLIGEEFEYLCKGIKNVKIQEDVYLDGELYDIDNFTANLENGILSIFVPKRDVKSLQFKTVINKNTGVTKLI
jgi:HSP20 family molecular chaperone IbpA